MALDSFGGEVIAVTVAGDPKITVGQPVQVEGLVALPWSQAGRSGVAFRAEATRLPAPRRPVSSQRRRLIQPRAHPAIQVSRRLSPACSRWPHYHN